MRLRVMITEVTSLHFGRRRLIFGSQVGLFTAIINSLASHETNAESIFFPFSFWCASLYSLGNDVFVL